MIKETRNSTLFYSQFIKICNERGKKPTPVLKAIGHSASNLKKWSSGSTASSEIIAALADYFNVSCDYFFYDISSYNKEIIKQNASYDHYLSWVNNGKAYLYEEEVGILCNYIHCTRDELQIDTDIIVPTPMPVKETDPLVVYSTIMACYPLNESIKAVQVKLSERILNNLEKYKICKEQLIQIGMKENTIDMLNNYDISTNSKTPLNFNWILKISNYYRIGVENIIKGKDEIYKENRRKYDRELKRKKRSALSPEKKKEENELIYEYLRKRREDPEYMEKQRKYHREYMRKYNAKKKANNE